MTWAERCDSVIGRVASSPAAAMPLLLAVTVLCIIPGIAALPVMGGLESGFMNGATAMSVHGDYATIRLQTGGRDLIWAPRGGYWMALPFAGEDAAASWMMRLPALLAGLGVPVAVWWTAIALMRPRAALLAGLFMAASGVFGLQARLAMPDTLQLLALVTAAGALARLWLPRVAEPRPVLAFVFWAALATAFLARGPVFPLALLATAAVLAIGNTGWVRRLRSSGGLAAIVIAVIVWLGVSLSAWVWDVFDYLTSLELRRLGATGINRAPPGTYLLLLPLLLGPAATYLFVALQWLVANAARAPVVFALAWLVPAWLVAEFWVAKSPYMILPALPPLTLMAGLAVDRGAARIRGWISWFYSMGPLIWPPLTAIALPIAFYYVEGSVPLLAYACLGAAAVLGPVAWVWLRQGNGVASAVMAVGSAMLIYWGFFMGLVPELNGLRVAERSVAAAQRVAACDEPLLVVSGYAEESLVLHAGTHLALATPTAAADFLDESGCRVALVERGRISTFRQRADDLGLTLVDHERVRGVNLRRLRRAEMHVFTLDPEAQQQESPR